jgi:N-ethylmaleimide reductase
MGMCAESDPNQSSEIEIMTDIWQPISLGSLKLPHRFAMAPMTRSRANPDGMPSDLAAEYYGQRASAGLLISEGTQPSDDGQGYLATPGIYTDAHVDGWRKVTTAVHDRGGRLFIQLMHVGRVSHPDNTPHHRQPVAPSAIAPGAQMFTLKGMLDIPEPRALSTQEINGTVEDFRIAARRAIEAGADGVEIHGANGYLIHQFLAPSANTRTDQYGGGIENRARFAIEVATAIVEEIGAEKTAIRLSPGAPMNGIDEGTEGPDLYRYLVGELNKLGLAYLHLLHLGDEGLLADIRQSWNQTLIINRPSRPRDQIGADVAAGTADIEAYGQMILANPDFIERLKADAPLNEGDRNTFYAGGAKGYIDYPTLEAASNPAST